MYIIRQAYHNDSFLFMKMKFMTRAVLKSFLTANRITFLNAIVSDIQKFPIVTLQNCSVT